MYQHIVYEGREENGRAREKREQRGRCVEKEYGKVQSERIEHVSAPRNDTVWATHKIEHVSAASSKLCGHHSFVSSPDHYNSGNGFC